MMLPTLPQPMCGGCTLDGTINDAVGDDQNSGVPGAALTACSSADLEHLAAPLCNAYRRSPGWTVAAMAQCCFATVSYLVAAHGAARD